MSKIIDMVGKKYGRLTVISKAESAKYGQTQHLCRCDCGTERIFQSANIRNGVSLSCGCLRKEITASRNKEFKHTHGMCKSYEYKIWGGMITRCALDHPRNSSHFGRGIKVCKRWLKFENFISDMGLRPSRLHSIDRINNDGNYEPSNCRWATKTDQIRNRTNTQYIEHEGEKRTIQEWADITGINYQTLYRRFRNGWSSHKALNRG